MELFQEKEECVSVGGQRFCGKTGAISETGRKNEELSFDWEIRDYSALSRERLDFYESPDFGFCGARWCLSVVTRGSLCKYEYIDRIAIRLERKEAEGPAVQCELSIAGAGESEVQKRMLSEKTSLVWIHFSTRWQHLVGPNDSMIVLCRMRRDLPPPARGIEKFVKDIGKLLVSGHKSDITVEVKEAEFKVHSFILSARSPVFSAMLEHDTAERASKKIRIDDCEPHVFEKYLEYLYSGSVQSLTAQTVFGLFAVADKYLADDLKLLCLEHIQKALSVETFSDAIKLALTHRLDDLLQLAIDFASKNFVLIATSLEWQDFLNEYPEEANEILVKSFSSPR